MKTIVTVQEALKKNDNILQGSFLTISNTLKQFPVLNLITPEAYARPVCFIKYYKFRNLESK